MNRIKWPLVLLGLMFFANITPLSAQESSEEPGTETHPAEAQEPMTLERLNALILAVDEDVERPQENLWAFHVSEVPVTVIADPRADRMRIMVAIAGSETLEPAQLLRLMQANFDSALDARYAVARGVVWGAYIHPLSPLGDEEFLSGLGQTVNLATSYGTSYSSGLFNFGGGDSNELERRRLIEELLKKGEKV